MRRKIPAVLPFMIALALGIGTTAYATDLPIDISAIGRQNQGSLGGPVMPRIGANLFTDDAHIVNELLAGQVRYRQEASSLLFSAVPLRYTPDPQAQIMTAAEGLALFAQPTSFNNFTTAQDTDRIPIWLTVLVFVVCAALGFVLALISRTMKKKSHR
jgi:hypothetical protein